MFKVKWCIENFSLFLEKLRSRLDSPCFEVKSMNNIKVCTTFRKSQSCDNVIHFYLLPKNEKEVFKPNIKVQIIFTRSNISKSLDLTLLPGFTNVYTAKVVDVGKLKSDPEVQDLFSSADKAEIELVIQNPLNEEPADRFTCCCIRTVVRLEHRVFDLPLAEVSEYQIMIINSPGRYLQLSRTFSIEEHADSFEFILEFEESLKNNSIEIRKLCEIDSEIFLGLKVSLISEMHHRVLICDKYFFEAGSGNEFWKMPFEINAKEMEDFTTLRCEIIVSKGKVSYIENCHSPATKIKYTKLSYKDLPSEKIIPTDHIVIKSDKNVSSLLKNMFATKMLCDVTLQIGDHQFKAHKNVLGSVSDVFAAMFTNKMKEQETGVVTIRDIDSDTLDKMLQFIYTGEVDNLSIKSIIKLYSVAVKYQIIELKHLCSLKLKENVGMYTVLDILELADMHQDNTLLESARNFIYANRKKVFNSQDWKSFMDNKSELAADVMLKYCKES